jgi:cytochrome d ubiquinol oxidase subunit I
MNSLLLARLQFGFTAGFHFLFPPATFGLTLIIVGLETAYLLRRKDIYRDISSFLVRILGVVFVLGAATGLTLEFAFGNNWSAYSRTVGDIFGAPLAAEGIFAFFLESVFLGVLLFGRRRVSARVYWLSAFLVFFAAHLSGVWILIANSWMQTPAGFALEGGRAVLTDFGRAALNHSTVVRFVHTVLGGWITGSLAAAGLASWYLLRNRWRDRALVLLKASTFVFASAAVLQLGSGHFHSTQVVRTQPEKMAAFEAMWHTARPAPFTVFGIPDAKKQKTHLLVQIPGLLSLLVSLSGDKTVLGLDAFPPDERPPVFVPFAGYHLMILFGLLFILLGILTVPLAWRRKRPPPRWLLKTLLWTVPLPFLANELGWVSAEVGRQPWAVYHLLRTADAVSPSVPAGNVLFSITVFGVLYALLAATGLVVLFRLIRKGPSDSSTPEEG